MGLLYFTDDAKISYYNYFKWLAFWAGEPDTSKVQGVPVSLIVKASCLACHEWTAPKDGPAYMDVLGKYASDKQSLVDYLLDPKPMQPNIYPLMENPELEAEEAEAISEYLLVEFGKRKDLK